MTDKINELLRLADETYHNSGYYDSYYNRTMARIDGMIDALSMITGKEYWSETTDYKRSKSTRN